MAGIYLHIPFCRQKCHYCNFYSLASLKHKDGFLKAIIKEINFQKTYLGNETINTIYFGGGTPSLLSLSELNKLFDELYRFFIIDPDVEITLEANPDDLTEPKLKELAQSPVNRLSIGIQSFHDEDLHYLNRVHSAEQAHQCIRQAQDKGFQNLTIDLIYGIPTLTDDRWIENMEKFAAYDLPHLSAYALTVEPHTALEVLIRKKKMKAVDDEQTIRQFNSLLEFAARHGYNHYEISNFCRELHYSIHNTHYWQGKKYLGLGPSAHSYDQISRQWNVSSVQKYIASIEAGHVPAEREILTAGQQYNEYVMLSLRTMWGADINRIRELSGEKGVLHFKEAVNAYIQKGLMEIRGDQYILTTAGKALADGIAADLFK
ncbi:MAG: radical SAM family heme chaperone HemW [Bacteroidetes bacterium]|nr:radical SAM family heme chaperone HemW [Bacteroidota bacterium]